MSPGKATVLVSTREWNCPEESAEQGYVFRELKRESKQNRVEQEKQRRCVKGLPTWLNQRPT